jgi:hypothetical protein
MSATVVQQAERQRPVTLVLPAVVQRTRAAVAVVVVESAGFDDENA